LERAAARGDDRLLDVERAPLGDRRAHPDGASRVQRGEEREPVMRIVGVQPHSRPRRA
jgi:hypothetical protein